MSRANRQGDSPLNTLGRRERQIMNAVFRLGRASVADVLAALDDAPSYSSVRTMLRYLEAKGFLRHVTEGRSYIYFPAIRADVARRSALSDLVRTFFGGSRARAVAALLDVSDTDLSDEDFSRMRAMVRRAKGEPAP
jgi:predicted transcriptional regulator